MMDRLYHHCMRVGVMPIMAVLMDPAASDGYETNYPKYREQKSLQVHLYSFRE
jgi:hypothetical protein